MTFGDTIWDTITGVGYGLIAIFSVLFLVAFSRVNWRAHPWGRNVMAFMTVLAVLDAMLFCRKFLGDWAGRPQMVAGLVVLSLVTVVWRLILQVRSNRRQKSNRERVGRHQERASHETET